MRPRDYQLRAHKAIHDEWTRHVSTLLVMPTGTGKTVTFARVVHECAGRAMVIAHREELIHQAANTIERVTGHPCEIEMAERRADRGMFRRAKVVIASKDSLHEKRLARFDPMEFGVLVVDECHHSVSPSYRRIIDYFKQNPKLRVLGVTATPDRLDEKALGMVFESCAMCYEILDAIEDGYLVPIQQRTVAVESLNYKDIGTIAGDFNQKQLADLMEFEENLHAIADPVLKLSRWNRTLIFAAGVKHADRLCEILNRHRAGCARFVHGNTPKDERKIVIQDYAAGRFQYLVNVGVFCLDEQTEILTDQGWTGIDEMTYQHRVANWDQGRIFFEEPKFIIRRDRLPGERMVSLETKNRSIRVTEDHRMLYRTYSTGVFKIMHAGELAGKKAELPICGHAEPWPIVPDQEASKPLKRRIEANAYNLRRATPGLSVEESKTEAAHRIAARESLRRADPAELTIAECHFIGFWLGDGSLSQLKSGGVEYTAFQSTAYPKIIAWIDGVIAGMEIDCTRRQVKGKEGIAPHIRWGFSRGTGFGPQRRRGLYRLEPYLKKDGTHLFWGLNSQQFDAMMYGLWMADGEHGSGERKPESIRVAGVNRGLFDMLQAVAVCRGYRANLHQSRTVHQPHHTPLLRLSLSKRDQHAMTKYRLEIEDGWRPERVWCVTSTTGNIITRRRGTVTVTGNTEGFDDPGIGMVAIARPTKSRALYAQCIGRGTRPLPGVIDGLDTPDERRDAIRRSRKSRLEVLDFEGQAGTHKLITTADVLGGDYDQDVIDLAAGIVSRAGGEVVDTVEALKEAAKVRHEEKQREAEIEAKRRHRLLAQVDFTTRGVDPFAVFDIAPKRVREWERQTEPPSDKQIGALKKFGVPTEGLTKQRATQLIGECIHRREKGLCSYKMAAQLRKRGLDPRMRFEDAKKVLDDIAAREGWGKKKQEVTR